MVDGIFDSTPDASSLKRMAAMHLPRAEFHVSRQFRNRQRVFCPTSKASRRTLRSARPAIRAQRLLEYANRCGIRLPELRLLEVIWKKCRNHRASRRKLVTIQLLGRPMARPVGVGIWLMGDER